MGARKTCYRCTSSFTAKRCRLLRVPNKKRRLKVSGSASIPWNWDFQRPRSASCKGSTANEKGSVFRGNARAISADELRVRTLYSRPPCWSGISELKVGFRWFIGPRPIPALRAPLAACISTYPGHKFSSAPPTPLNSTPEVSGRSPASRGLRHPRDESLP